MAMWIVLGVIVIFFAYLIKTYNSLVELRQRIANAFAQIDVQLQRRYDLIPNLVDTVKGAMAHERETLEAVIAARNQAQAAARAVMGSPTDGAALQQLANAESQLGGVLGRLVALAEAYPELKAQQNMGQLQEELASTENRVAFARQAFNDAVMSYNTQRESFPDALVASQFGFKPAQMWRLDKPEAAEPVRVSFSR